MTPESNSRRLFGITRSKGKMFEMNVPETAHIAIPEGSEPQELFPLTVGTLGDAAALLASETERELPQLTTSWQSDLSFAARFFDAFLESRLAEGINFESGLLAAAAYYLAGRPGSSQVLALRADYTADHPAVDHILHWTLRAQWQNYPAVDHPVLGQGLNVIAQALAYHFYDGSQVRELAVALHDLRDLVYRAGSPQELLYVDLIAAVIGKRLAASAWITLPRFTGIGLEEWAPAIRRADFPKELWPSQILLGEAGLFSGKSGMVQMPTSAGKTRAVEIVLRSGFLSGRTKLAVIVAPFRALCHEIATSLRRSFANDDVKVNELSDAINLDFLEQVAELLGTEAPASRYVVVLTPEKFLYVLRQAPTLLRSLGIVVYDEGHQFDSGSRGITYELLITEIKPLLPAGAQTILLSAVIHNAAEIAKWLIGEDAQVVNGTKLLPTSRSIAFASWIERLGQLQFFDSEDYRRPDFFVPRVIEVHTLEKRGKERAERTFPERGRATDVALYLGLRLVHRGAVAIFCGRKDTASAIAARTVEVYDRALAMSPPAASANPEELRRLKRLIELQFGGDSEWAKAAAFGVFVHHGATPQGLRLSLEHAMQRSLISFVVCTSTLAQGVNLPLRYLIVPSTQQGEERIKVRDFQNLIGRAGRSGMHTEGLIIFADPSVYDERRTEAWKFARSVNLLDPDQAESTSSSLLQLLAPFEGRNGRMLLRVAPGELVDLLLSDENSWMTWANTVATANPRVVGDPQTLVSELRHRRRLLVAAESYLMANRGASPFEEFRLKAEQLAQSTLAYFLATDEVKPAITKLFAALAEYVESRSDSPQKLASYSKTLLGVDDSLAIEQWVAGRRDVLLELQSNESWLDALWELFTALNDDKFFHSVLPQEIAARLGHQWIQGARYIELFQLAFASEATKPWGKQRRRVTQDEIINFCENTLAFDCCLIVAAVAQFLFGDTGADDPRSIPLAQFQKSLKYGLPDLLSISCYEYGFADRVLAQELSFLVTLQGFTGSVFAAAANLHHFEINAILENYPSYFAFMFASRN